MAVAGAPERFEPLVAEGYAASRSQSEPGKSVMVLTKTSDGSEVQVFAKRPAGPEVDSVRQWLEPGEGSGSWRWPPAVS
jgi:hypothetical protein